MKSMPIETLSNIESTTNLVVGRKYNGFNESIVVHNGSVRVFNRSGTEQTSNIPHITNIRVPNSMSIIIPCEGIAPSDKVEDAKSIFGSYPQYAIDWQDRNGLAIMVAINITKFENEDVTDVQYGDRIPLLSESVSVLKSFGMNNLIQETLHNKNKMAIFTDIIENGGEGVVVKNLLGYEHDWYKVKKVKSWDTIIIGFTMANYGKTGKFAGLIGAIRYGFYSHGGVVETGKCSGMDDAQRHMFTDNSNSYIGKVIEIKGQEIGNQGAIVFPRFIRIRDDKPPSECILVE